MRKPSAAAVLAVLLVLSWVGFLASSMDAQDVRSDQPLHVPGIGRYQMEVEGEWLYVINTETAGCWRRKTSYVPPITEMKDSQPIAPDEKKQPKEAHKDAK